MFAEIRDGCAWVAEQARAVRLDHDRLDSYARELIGHTAAPPALDPAHHYLGEAGGTVMFLLALDSINFGSGYFPHLRKLPGLSGYFTMATHLTQHFRRYGPWTAADLASLRGEDCRRVFGQQDTDAVVGELMVLFARALNDLGALLLERFGGEPGALVEAADGRAENLVGILATMPFFRDVERYGERDVPFYKRAQLTAADLALAFGGQGCGAFCDLDQLTIFADNLVPHVLRVDGVLRYDEHLATAIDAGELIPAGSAEEVEIRAVALHTVELLAGRMIALGKPSTAMQLDYVLWNRGQQHSYKARPRHRTRTVFY